MIELPTGTAILIIYIVGQGAVAVVAPLLTYFLTKPHLDRVAAKADIVAVRVEEVAQAVNGATIVKVADAHAQGVIEGAAAERANPT